MILKECQDLIVAYTNWLREKITIEEIKGFCEITTPFLDRHNDSLQIYVKQSNGGLQLSDDGYTIKDLRMSGCEFNTEKRKLMLRAILNGFGIHLQGDELTVEAQIQNFPQKKHNLLQAMMAINDMFVLATPLVASIFREDVEKFLKAHEIRFTPAVKFTGRTGYDHFFDFVIPASKAKPERILRAINRPNRQTAINLVFAWNDTKEDVLRIPLLMAFLMMLIKRYPQILLLHSINIMSSQFFGVKGKSMLMSWQLRKSLVLAKALTLNPILILLDEHSLGLSQKFC